MTDATSGTNSDSNQTSNPAAATAAAPDRNYRFAGCGVVVSGAGSGIGRAATLAFAREGANVYAIDINGDALAETAELAAGAGTVHTGVHDISSRSSCVEAIDAAAEQLGGIRILGNIAGVSWAEHVGNVTEAMWDQMLAVNLSGVFWMTQAALPHLLEQPPGDDTSPSASIVNIASSAAIMGQAFTVPYCATKGAVALLTKSLAMEFAKTDLRVNAVAPGGVDTSMTQNFSMPGDVDYDLVGRYMGFRGMSQPENIVAAIMFLASAEAARIHGVILPVDAGMTAG